MKLNLIFWTSILFLYSCKSQEKKTADLDFSKDFMRGFINDSLKPLLPILDSVLLADQKYRKGNNAKTLKKYSKEIQMIDSINLERITPIIEKYGILGPNDIGGFGYYAIMMTIQHADLKTQEKYLPLFKKGLQDRKVMPNNYAMLLDRIEVKNKRLQIYGTQVMINNKNKEADLFPIISPDSIDIRRKSIGMVETIGEYVKHFGITWNLEEYKKQLPALKLKYKIVD